MQAAPVKQLVLTDPDARSMKTRGTGIVGYNVQTAVDTRHHLIVAHEVTKKKCTTSTEPCVKRWEHEAVLEAMQARLKDTLEAMQIRKQTVEHPFGTLKAWMGATHFYMKTPDHVSTEMSLHGLARNLKRVMKILGIGPLMQAMIA